MTMPAYHLTWKLHTGLSHDIMCRIVEFPGWDTNTRLASIRSLFQPSEPVRFDAHFELVELDAPDYPNNTPNWPIMSLRMLEVLLSVGQFPHHIIPVTLVQDTIPVEVRYDATGRPKPEYSKTDYVAVQLMSHVDVLDTERSVYRVSSMFPDRALKITKHVFKVPEDSLPPLFRIPIRPIDLFVSAKARAALEAAGIEGPVYKHPDKL